MENRLAFASLLEEGRSQILEDLKNHPQEIEWHKGKVECIRVVLDTPEQLERLIVQLKNESLLLDEAVSLALRN